MSMNRTLEGSQHVRHLFQRGFADRRIAVGTLEPAFGMEMPTRGKTACHFTLWARRTAVIHPAFAADAERADEPR
jgi:hypothetical protein